MADPLQTKVELEPGESGEAKIADMIVSPTHRAAFMHYVLAAKLFGPGKGKPDQRPGVEAMIERLESDRSAVASGDLGLASNLLASQAQILDALFTDFMHRSLENAGEYPEAMQRYMSLAMKAQMQSRSTLDSLIRLHQPREQIVRHVHVHDGGQAVVADEFHQHVPGLENAGSDKQAQTPRAPQLIDGPAVPCPDPFQAAVPVASRSGEEAMSHARGRQRQRRAGRKPKRT